MHHQQETPWHALFVRPKLERVTARALRERGFEEYLPVYGIQRRWSDRVKTLEAALFPGYLFCRFSFADRLRVLNTPGVQSIVGFGRTPAPVSSSEIAAIRALLASGRAISPWSYLPIGQNVTIEEGPFAGLRGVILRMRDTARVIVSVEALDRSISIEIDRECVSARQPTRQPSQQIRSPLLYGNSQA